MRANGVAVLPERGAVETDLPLQDQLAVALAQVERSERELARVHESYAVAAMLQGYKPSDGGMDTELMRAVADAAAVARARQVLADEQRLIRARQISDRMVFERVPQGGRHDA